MRSILCLRLENSLSLYNKQSNMFIYFLPLQLSNMFLYLKVYSQMFSYCCPGAKEKPIFITCAYFRTVKLCTVTDSDLQSCSGDESYAVACGTAFHIETQVKFTSS